MALEKVPGMHVLVFLGNISWVSLSAGLRFAGVCLYWQRSRFSTNSRVLDIKDMLHFLGKYWFLECHIRQ